MNLKIKCDTPKEQVLVLRKFKKLVPECKWVRGGEPPTDWFPFAYHGDSADQCFIILKDFTITWDYLTGNICDDSLIINASDFLRDDWKFETEKSEVLAKIQSLETQLNELKSLIDQ